MKERQPIYIIHDGVKYEVPEEINEVNFPVDVFLHCILAFCKEVKE